MLKRVRALALGLLRAAETLLGLFSVTSLQTLEALLYQSTDESNRVIAANSARLLERCSGFQGAK